MMLSFILPNDDSVQQIHLFLIVIVIAAVPVSLASVKKCDSCDALTQFDVLISETR